MVAGCGSKVAKFTLFLINFLLFILGIASIAAGAWVSINQDNFFNTFRINSLGISTSLIQSGAYVFIGVGCFIVLVSFFGCCGAQRESRCLLGVYAGILIILLIIEIVAIILAVVYKNELYTTGRQLTLAELHASFDGVGANSTNDFSASYSMLQMELHCCGPNNWKDYSDKAKFKSWMTSGSDIVPVSCCKLNPGETYPWDKRNDYIACTRNPMTNNAYLTGCFDILESSIDTYIAIIIGICVSIIVVEIVLVMFAFCLMKAVGTSGDIV